MRIGEDAIHNEACVIICKKVNNAFESEGSPRNIILTETHPAHLPHLISVLHTQPNHNHPPHSPIPHTHIIPPTLSAHTHNQTRPTPIHALTHPLYLCHPPQTLVPQPPFTHPARSPHHTPSHAIHPAPSIPNPYNHFTYHTHLMHPYHHAPVRHLPYVPIPAHKHPTHPSHPSTTPHTRPP